MAINIFITTPSGTSDATQLVPTVSWSGDYKQCARTLDFGLLSSPTDKNIPVVDCPLGAGVVLATGGEELFNGFVVTRTKSTESSVIDVAAFDRGFYIKRNTASYKFVNMTPEDITKRVCADFGIKAGHIEKTGVKVSRNFIAVSLYQIIQTAYTLASQKTGDQYQIRFEGETLGVVKKGANENTLLITGRSNLMSASTTESIADMVNQVQVIDKNGKVLGTYDNKDAIGLYGLLLEQLRQTKGKDAAAEAKKFLADRGTSQKITVNNLGDVRCITGNAVVVQEPYTGLFGLFYIDSDVHTWKNGLYFNKLVLNFMRIMDEQEAGSAVSASVSGSGSSGSPWKYLYKPGE